MAEVSRPDPRTDVIRPEVNRSETTRPEPRSRRNKLDKTWTWLMTNWIKVMIGAVIVIAVIAIWIWSAGRSKTVQATSVVAQGSATATPDQPRIRTEEDVKDCLATLANTPPGLNPESTKAKEACGVK